MTLQEYYKRKLFEFGFNTAFVGREKDLKVWSKKMEAEMNSIYFQDEMDYYICADYYGMTGYFTDKDKKFLAALGFVENDFVDEMGENE